MAENIKIKASTRTIVGKTKTRLDREQLAAVVYGPAIDSKAVAVDRHAFQQILVHEGNISSKVIDLVVDGAPVLKVIIKSITRDPRKGHLQHIDFWAVNMKQLVSTTVPIHFEGDAPGVRTGGVLMSAVQHVNIEALPDNLPEALFFDISEMEIGDSVHIKDLVAPKGVTILDAEDEVVATLMPPAAEEEEEVVEGEEAVEPELIGEKPDEE